MAKVRIFSVRQEEERYAGEPFLISSDFAHSEIARKLNELENTLGPHKTLSIIPEFPREPGNLFSTDSSHLYGGKVVALYCIVTF